MKKYWLHFKTICKHKWYVFLACKDCGITWRGIKHDLSKFSHIEFNEYARNFIIGKSPVDVCKEKYGYCKSWQHHKGRNSHHWHYWVDFVDGQAVPLKMPYEDMVELICDWIGAGKAYGIAKWTQSEPYDYWISKKNTMLFHPDTYEFIEDVLWHVKKKGWDACAPMLKSKLLPY